MQRRGDLRLNHRGTRRRGVQSAELFAKCFHTIECCQIARKLRGQLFVFENSLRDAGALRILIMPAPGPQACTIQVDHGDLAVGCLETLVIEHRRFGHCHLRSAT